MNSEWRMPTRWERLAERWARTPLETILKWGVVILAADMVLARLGSLGHTLARWW